MGLYDDNLSPEESTDEGLPSQGSTDSNMPDEQKESRFKDTMRQARQLAMQKITDPVKKAALAVGKKAAIEGGKIIVSGLARLGGFLLGTIQYWGPVLLIIILVGGLVFGVYFIIATLLSGNKEICQDEGVKQIRSQLGDLYRQAEMTNPCAIGGSAAPSQ